MEKNTPYCNSLIEYKRVQTKAVKVGNIYFGAHYPIRVQSMTTADTMDTENSVDQAIRMIDAGCELVRYTAPSKKEAENLKVIRQKLDEKGYHTPIVADIHFTPNAAEVAALHIEKIRVNPGNYADKKKFEEIEYTDASYQAELVRIREKFTPLVLLCKQLKRAIRIGTNHGSLSDRIMSRYGDSPLGMVESALEFIQICEDNEFYDLVISMKSSNPIVMVHAYRLLMAKMMERGNIYPLHLGVTEAGEGEDGRIKSAVGIGTLLEDGLGDTIRVSLTEEPEFEIPVAKKLAERYENRHHHADIIPFEGELPYNPYEYQRRHAKEMINVGGKNHPVVISDLSHVDDIKPAHLFGAGYTYNIGDDKWNIKEQAVDYIFTENTIPTFQLPGTLGVIVKADKWEDKNQVYPLFPSIKAFQATTKTSSKLNFVRIDAHELALLKEHKNILNNSNIVLVLSSNNLHRMAEQRRFFMELVKLDIQTPIIPYKTYADIDNEAFQLYASTDFGALLIDGFSDGIWIHTENCSNLQLNTSTAFGILQATRTRISKTDYISCPSCGRTLFDLQITTAKIRNRTNHLKGLKIGIMGCIVNGPGEMADADYGYVGVGKGKINLYKEKTVVKKNVTEEEAVNELVELIKEYGDWVEPKVN
ncbi:4-hydroxy-3-methylbut-2-en-1-yl diphosphate synthase [Putridiphycobacter roseus]|uniref:4-hydroxy-3-methylbut-2-en-1-yl diphosphate synthase (flavodoxin) n=1 Tax=Putridiphycobacter roseus TaxID=2219161 RepID=A0A2W1N084_9FLAO|nr:(E)-4-hydroxy-3-methylbut-2-enyl-diphosphate synthase [Putridiphycobacter roseus]PZE16321.1 4-hydroxy-3-methylbut-2-en-1-yl diphosphate synthase [Putridiphycobacter roseus]